MDQERSQISINLEDASLKQRCNERLEKLKNSHDATSKPAGNQLLHKELIGKKKVMTRELYEAVKNGNVDNFVDVLEQECTNNQDRLNGNELSLSDIFDQVTLAGDSLLHVAAEMGRDQIAELICDHFPELLIKRNNLRGDTPLHVAVRSNNSTIVKLMLSQHETVKLKHDKEITRETNEYWDTPLHEAVYTGNVDVVKELILKNKDVVHCLNKSKRSPLYLAVVYGNEEILNVLLQIPFPPNQPLPLCLGNSPLHAAIWERKPALIKNILMKKPEVVYLRDEDGGTPLHYAAYIGYVEGFRILLEKSLEKSDQNILEPNNKGDLPIHLACNRGHIRVVKEFLQHELPVNPCALLNKKGQNILHVVAMNGNCNLVRCLLRNHKIDQFTINQKDYEGNTPLHLASINLFPEVLFLLTRDRRINVKLTNNNNFTAKDIVYLALEIQMTNRKFLCYHVLHEVGAPLKVKDMLRSQIQQQPKLKLKVKADKLLNTFLVVATLMVTVTFAAAFTVPGGVYSSDDRKEKNRGMAVLAHKPLFWVFTTFNTVSLYSSVMACGSILVVILFEIYIPLYFLIIIWLGISFLTVPVSFLAALSLVVANNSVLDFIIAGIGVVHTLIILLGLFLTFFPIGVPLPLIRQVGSLALVIMIALIKYNDKPEDLSAQKENKDDDD